MTVTGDIPCFDCGSDDYMIVYIYQSMCHPKIYISLYVDFSIINLSFKKLHKRWFRVFGE